MRRKSLFPANQRRRVAPVPVTFPDHNEGGPGPSLSGTGDIDPVARGPHLGVKRTWVPRVSGFGDLGWMRARPHAFAGCPGLLLLETWEGCGLDSKSAKSFPTVTPPGAATTTPPGFPRDPRSTQSAHT